MTKGLFSEESAARTGVADYFAVLGVGDRLTWKHQQKQQTEGKAVIEDDEDLADYQQRFDREIVDVDIFVTEGNSDDSILITETPSLDPSVDTMASRVQRSLFNVIPPSPSLSDATTSFTASSNAPTFLSSSQTHHRTDDGWIVIESTLPSATPIYAPTSHDMRIGNNGTPKKGPIIWNKSTVWNANLDFASGLGSHVLEQLLGQHKQEKQSKSLTGLRHKMESTLSQFKHLTSIQSNTQRSTETIDSHRFYLAYRRRRQSNWNHSPDFRPAIADVKLCYIRIHCSSLTRPATSSLLSGASRLSGLAGQVFERYQSQAKLPPTDKDLNLVNLRDYIALPDGFEEWAIPNEYQWIRDPHSIAASPRSQAATAVFFSSRHRINNNNDDQSVSSSGTPTSGSGFEVIASMDESGRNGSDASILFPQVIKDDHVRGENRHCIYIPALAIRRQKTGDEERYHEDAGIVDLAVTFLDQNGPVMPHSTDDEDDEDGTFRPLGKSDWVMVGQSADTTNVSFLNNSLHNKPGLGSIALLARKNSAFGFADVAFATRVLGRFPQRNYKNLPLPEEELPMFCYPTGCRLHRAKLSDEPAPQYYGFVVKNERGDSIYVSCVSFMEPLTPDKELQLEEMSAKRAFTSLPHKQFCEKRGLVMQYGPENGCSPVRREPTTSQCNLLLTSFDDMITFENKTICLVSRFPFWTAFRKFLLNLHLLAGSASDLPLERLISHLLLSVPLPRPGGPNLLVPLTALSEPMILTRPPEKDFPVVDLPYHRLFACLEVKTVAMIVLSLLALERKVIVMSTRPSLVLDVCELLKALLFPFELCAPYVPRLTEPFKSSLDFPGAIFVGIHDDGEAHGLAAVIRTTCPEDSIIVDLDTGEIACDGDRFDVLSKAWDIIPATPRQALVSELEALCRDAGIADGQEPLDSQFEESFGVSLLYPVEDTSAKTSTTREPFDDRAVRDTFLRFFCAVLGGYERYLVVPDADFLVSGNEWFDAKGYLASVPQELAPYLNCLVSTQLFQSFIQKRTEASDIHCLLFDESLAEYHSSTVPYGRLGGDVEVYESASGPPHMLYSLLVDQSASPSHYLDSSSMGKSFDASEGDSYLNLSKGSHDLSILHHSELAMNQEVDVVTAPCHDGLPHGKQYMYCVEGNPCFPHTFDADLFLPREPESYFVEISEVTTPLLARSERELEEANRRRRLATSQRGYQAQRRCLWQLPKLMGSHLLGSWLLCIPTLVSQEHLSHEQRSRYLLRALGALRLLRSKQRIVPDEAAYRALMVACGRNRSDRRVELVKLFGLLRSDGIFPSAVTLGQYTKALGEGYSKRSIGVEKEDDFLGVEVTEPGSKVGRVSFVTQNQRSAGDIESLDPSLLYLEEHGRRWRQRGANGNPKSVNEETDKKKHSGSRGWLPVNYSTSFAPLLNSSETKDDGEFRFVALWSRTRGCTSCSYIPLEEEVQAGWDVVGGEHEIPGSIACPRCGTMILPMLGYRDMSFAQAKQMEAPNYPHSLSIADFQEIPPQLSPSVQSHSDDDGVSYVAYISPATLRLSLEQYVEDYGEDILCRERMRELDPEVFYNFWWFCARFSLPFPLKIDIEGSSSRTHYCAVVAWDRAASERGCWSAAKVLSPIFDDDIFQNSMATQPNLHSDSEVEENHLLSRFNLQGYFSSVWDHPDLSTILVALVEACDKRDFKPVVDAVVRCNYRRHQEYDPIGNVSMIESDDFEGAEVAPGSDASALSLSVELDLYRTVLYLAKYQCTTAFHTFFPATMKSCKGYHYWCAIGTPLPMFDRLLRDGVQRFNSTNENKPLKDFRTPSEVALGFRCVFGHLV